MYYCFNSLRSWREWVCGWNFWGEAASEIPILPILPRDQRGFLHSRSGPKFARVPTPAGYAGYCFNDVRKFSYKGYTWGRTEYVLVAYV